MSDATAPRAFREPDARLVAGVAAGLAGHLGWPVAAVRIGFAVLALCGGLGLALYAAYWLVLPLRRGDGPAADRREPGLLPILSLGAVLLGAALLASAIAPTLDLGSLNGLLTAAVVMAAVGAAIIWRQADDEQRDAWRSDAGPARWWRVGGGLGLIALGALLLVVGASDPQAAVRGLLVGLVVAAGLALLAMPWIRRQWEAAHNERTARIREAERAEVAAAVHDSVLQTLTLIRTHSDDPETVTRLARAEERRLRTWLYQPAAEQESALRAALDGLAASVEAAHPVTVEVVVVGDCALTPPIRAMLAASAEAMRNAAEHAGTTVTLYAEVEPDRTEVFIRDRGPGFDPAAVPPDRLGVRESIVGRMERNGGSAQIRTGESGTEVRLVMPA